MSISPAKQKAALELRERAFSRAQEIRRLDNTKHDLDPSSGRVILDDHYSRENAMWTTGSAEFDDQGRPVHMRLENKSSMARLRFQDHEDYVSEDTALSVKDGKLEVVQDYDTAHDSEYESAIFAGENLDPERFLRIPAT